MGLWRRLWPFRGRPKRQNPDGACRIVISYTSHHPHDTRLAVGLHNCIERRGADAFLDRADLRVGRWAPTIDAAIASCSHFVVIVSEATSQSKEVDREIRLARDYEDEGVDIVPVVVGNPRQNPVFEFHSIMLADVPGIDSATGEIEYI